MRRRMLWRTVLAGAVIGLVEAAGLDRGRRARRRRSRAVWLDDREPTDPLARAGVWFLDPIPHPRPEPSDRRRPAGGGLRLARFRRDALAGSLRTRDS